jgi:CubicO group peptidase (beta-lactamase class C family)
MKSEATQLVAPPTGPSDRFAAVYRLLDEAIAEGAFPGCAFGAMVGSEVVLKGARGRFTFEENAPAVTPETRYDVASLTKVMATTAAAMLLHQRGLLDLETPLGELLPGFVAGCAADDAAGPARQGNPAKLDGPTELNCPAKPENRAKRDGLAEQNGQEKRNNRDELGSLLRPEALTKAENLPKLHNLKELRSQVRLRHLLAHNSGLPGYVEFFRTATTAEAVMKACQELPLEAEPGARAVYSDPGFILLGKAMEALTGEALDVWLRREIFQPLGLAATGFCPPAGEQGSIPPTEEEQKLRYRRIQGEVQDENAWLLGGVAGHAGLFSSVGDLLRFSREILSAAKNLSASDKQGSARLFDAATIEYFAQRQGPEGSSRALGWDTPSGNSSSGRHFSPHSIGHLGFSGCSLWMDLEAGIAVALLTNRTWPDRRSQLIRAVRPAFHDAVREAL